MTGMWPLTTGILVDGDGDCIVDGDGDCVVDADVVEPR